MKSFIWFVVGIGAGFAVAHQVSKTSQGKALFEDIDRKTRDFASAVSDGYRQREAEIRDAIDGARDTVSDR